jgi:hypothetical protein
MTGISIDHMISLAAFIAVLMVSMSAFAQVMSVAVIYQRNHQVSMKAAELANTLLLSPGNPIDWAHSNSTLLAFGLQDMETRGYSLDALSLSRLTSTQPLVYFPKTGLWYSNNSLGGGGTLLVPLTSALNYTTAAKLLGVEESYAFRLAVTPTLSVSLSELDLNPLTIKAEVRGLNGAVGNATLNYLLCVAAPGIDEYPSLQTLSGTSQTDPTGIATLEFSSVDCSAFAYSVIIYARISGLAGVGYRCRDSIVNNRIIPFVEDFNDRTVLLAHSWDVHNFPPPVTALYFNATFLSLSHDFQLNEVQLVNSSEFARSGLVNYGTNYTQIRAQIPTQSAGILLVAYRSGSGYGIAAMPWGIGVLGFPVAYGGDPSSSDWVAVELRQVAINRVSYQATVAVWRTSGYNLRRV